MRNSRLTLRQETLLSRAKLHAITRSPRLLILATCVVFSATAEAEESLLDKRGARSLSGGEQSLFGPRSEAFQYDARMIRAAEIAMRRARPAKTWYCWRYVKNALLEANVITSRPQSIWARQAGDELCRRYGFARLDLDDPRKAPIGAVIVYGGPDAGHVEIRTASGYVSDFISPTPYPRPLLGIYVKRS